MPLIFRESHGLADKGVGLIKRLIVQRSLMALGRASYAALEKPCSVEDPSTTSAEKISILVSHRKLIMWKFVSLIVAQTTGVARNNYISELSPHHIQQLKCPVQSLHKFVQTLMYLQKLFPSVHCAYSNPQIKFDTFAYKRDLSHFHTCKPGVFYRHF